MAGSGSRGLMKLLKTSEGMKRNRQSSFTSMVSILDVSSKVNSDVVCVRKLTPQRCAMTFLLPPILHVLCVHPLELHLQKWSSTRPSLLTRATEDSASDGLSYRPHDPLSSSSSPAKVCSLH